MIDKYKLYIMWINISQTYKFHTKTICHLKYDFCSQTTLKYHISKYSALLYK